MAYVLLWRYFCTLFGLYTARGLFNLDALAELTLDALLCRSTFCAPASPRIVLRGALRRPAVQWSRTAAHSPAAAAISPFKSSQVVPWPSTMKWKWDRPRVLYTCLRRRERVHLLWNPKVNQHVQPSSHSGVNHIPSPTRRRINGKINDLPWEYPLSDAFQSRHKIWSRYPFSQDPWTLLGNPWC